MPTTASPCVSLEQKRREIPKILLKPMALLLRTGHPHATVDRLFDSQHVRDLRLIVAAAFCSVLGVFLVLIIGFRLTLRDADLNQHWYTLAGNFLAVFAPVLAVFGGLLTWAYQVGSARLGVVDLFACEISTLCRVAVVVNLSRRCIDRFTQGPPSGAADASGSHSPPARQFSSLENYFPVFDSNLRDLQTLEAKVVINITEFYTFMKALRDSLRALADIRPDLADLNSPPDKAPAPGAWHEGARNVVYMVFLAMESARHAITDLVEFEPEQAGRTIVVLLSELEAFAFLRSQFKDKNNVFHRRIMLRAPEYAKLVPELRDCVNYRASEEAKTDPQKPGLWEPARLLLEELDERLRAALLSPPPAAR